MFADKLFTHIEITFNGPDGLVEKRIANIGPHTTDAAESVWIERFWQELDGLNERLRFVLREIGQVANGPISADIDSQEYPLGLPPRATTRPWTPADTVRWIEGKFLEHNPDLAVTAA
jgi:hypothetical protein